MAKKDELKERVKEIKRLQDTGGTFADHDPMRKPTATTRGTGRRGGTGTPGSTGTPGGSGYAGTPESIGAPEIPGYPGGVRKGNTWTRPDGTTRKGKKVWFDPVTLAKAQREAGRRRVSIRQLIAEALAAYLQGGEK